MSQQHSRGAAGIPAVHGGEEVNDPPARAPPASSGANPGEAEEGRWDDGDDDRVRGSPTTSGPGQAAASPW